MAGAISQAAMEVTEGQWDEQFPVDVFQTGSATSTNMNTNEVIARRAGEILAQGGGAGLARQVHPNDHVNLSQSSNDVIPSCIHIAALVALEKDLLPALARLRAALEAKSKEFAGVLKLGRTHLQDATPMTLGQEFSGYAAMVAHAIGRLFSCWGAPGTGLRICLLVGRGMLWPRAAKPAMPAKRTTKCLIANDLLRSELRRGEPRTAQPTPVAYKSVTSLFPTPC